MFNKKKEEDHNVWISFSDLYSGLMVIFIVVSLALAYKYKVDADKYRKIQTIQGTLANLGNSGLFEYNEECKRFEYKQDINFLKNSDVIPEDSKKNLIQAGAEIKKIISSLDTTDDVKIQIIVEGRTSIDSNSDTIKYNDLSYHRAVSLVRLWEGNSINLQSSKSELYVAGSGAGGQCRYSGAVEEKNRRFIIQIIPYIPKLK